MRTDELSDEQAFRDEDRQYDEARDDGRAPSRQQVEAIAERARAGLMGALASSMPRRMYRGSAANDTVAVASCSNCGKGYTSSTWRRLKYEGHAQLTPDIMAETRWCVCGRVATRPYDLSDPTELYESTGVLKAVCDESPLEHRMPGDECLSDRAIKLRNSLAVIEGIVEPGDGDTARAALEVLKRVVTDAIFRDTAGSLVAVAAALRGSK